MTTATLSHMVEGKTIRIDEAAELFEGTLSEVAAKILLLSKYFHVRGVCPGHARYQRPERRQVQRRHRLDQFQSEHARTECAD
jgi:hypothetical protein